MKIRKIAAAGMILSFAAVCGMALYGCGNSRKSEPETETAGVEHAENGSRTDNNTPESDGTITYASMKEIKKSVVELLGENYWPDRQLSEKELETETGISSDMYDEFMAEEMNVETDIDMMIILLSKKDRISEIETLLNEYRDNLMVKYKDRPQELGKVEASRIEIIGSYVCFVQLGADTSPAAEGGDEEILALCQQENERTVDVIEKTILE